MDGVERAIQGSEAVGGACEGHTNMAGCFYSDVKGERLPCGPTLAHFCPRLATLTRPLAKRGKDLSSERMFGPSGVACAQGRHCPIRRCASDGTTDAHSDTLFWTAGSAGHILSRATQPGSEGLHRYPLAHREAAAVLHVLSGVSAEPRCVMHSQVLVPCS